MPEERKHIVVSAEIKQDFDLCKAAHGQYLSTEGFIKFLVDTCHSAHCPECSGELKVKACSCKATDKL